MDEKLEKKLGKYFTNAKILFDGVELCPAKDFDARKAQEKIVDMAERYYQDARHFMEKGEHVNALAALEYAEGWLDAGRYTGLIKSKKPLDDI